MNADALIVARLRELVEESAKVAATRYAASFGLDGVNHQAFHKWATSCLSLLQRVFGAESDHYTNFRKAYEEFQGYAHTFERCDGILQAADSDYQGGYLFRVRSLVRADVLDTVLAQAEVLLKAGHKDPACVVVGVALESALKELCTQRGIPEGKLDRMNAELCKADAYNAGMQKQVTTWAHWRNKAAHGEWQEYTEADVGDMLSGVTRFVAERL